MRNRTVWLAALAVFCAVLATPLRARLGQWLPADAVQAAATRDDTFRRVWTVALPGFRVAAVSPDGRYVGTIFNNAAGTDHAKIALWRWADRPDRPLWSRAEPNASSLQVSRDGQSVMAWASMDPTQCTVSVRRGADGMRLLAPQMNGAVWDAQLSLDGQRAAVATGAHLVYLLTLGDRPLVHQWHSPLPGVGTSLAFSADGNTLAAATWDSGGISEYASRGNGEPLWRYPAQDSPQPAPGSRIFQTQSTRGGQSVFGMSYTNVRHGNCVLYLWHGTGGGSPAWQYALGPDAYQPKADVTADGRYIAVGYVHFITRGEQSVSVRRLALLDTSSDRPVWEQGNLLFSPQLVALTPDGQRITVSDGQHSLYNLNSQGRVTASYTLRSGGTIRQATATPDGRFVLVSTSDGMLSLIQIGSA